MKFWYQTASLWSTLLRPLSWLYGFGISIRRWCYRHGWFKSYRMAKPVVVIGNISVGGTGKTPIVIELVKQLQAQGLKPGVVSRGYGGHAHKYPFVVTPDADVKHSGDEPLMIARKSGCPVVVDPNRPRAAQHLLDQFGCDIILSDDGLQHYALQRDFEIIVRDAERGDGNGHFLPAGPLREPISRLQDADVVLDGCEVVIDGFYQLTQPDNKKHFDGLHGTVHAVAGIGNPNKFFNLLRNHGLEVIEHPFVDHHKFIDTDIIFADDHPVLMTEKDAVKCVNFANPNHWVVAIRAQLPNALLEKIKTLVVDI